PQYGLAARLFWPVGRVLGGTGGVRLRICIPDGAAVRLHAGAQGGAARSRRGPGDGLSAAMRLMHRAFAASLLLTVSACALTPDTRGPQAPVPAGWRTVAAPVPAEAPSAEWWRAFGSDELVRLQAEARRNNPDLEAAVSR